MSSLHVFASQCGDVPFLCFIDELFVLTIQIAFRLQAATSSTAKLPRQEMRRLVLAEQVLPSTPPLSVQSSPTPTIPGVRSASPPGGKQTEVLLPQCTKTVDEHAMVDACSMAFFNWAIPRNLPQPLPPPSTRPRPTHPKTPHLAHAETTPNGPPLDLKLARPETGTQPSRHRQQGPEPTRPTPILFMIDIPRPHAHCPPVDNRVQPWDIIPSCPPPHPRTSNPGFPSCLPSTSPASRKQHLIGCPYSFMVCNTGAFELREMRGHLIDPRVYLGRSSILLGHATSPQTRQGHSNWGNGPPNAALHTMSPTSSSNSLPNSLVSSLTDLV